MDVVGLLSVDSIGPWTLPGDAEDDDADDDDLQGSDDGGDEDVVEFPRTRNHIQDVILFILTLRPAEARVTAAGRRG